MNLSERRNAHETMQNRAKQCMNSRKEQALTALISSNSVAAAAASSGISVRTMFAYLGEDEFRAEYDRRRAVMLDDACRTLQRALTDAAETLAAIMRNDENSPATRIMAAKSVLDYGVKLTELTDLARRVEALERLKEGGSP